MMKIGIVGTQGIPAKYGGFETLVEFLAEYLSKKYEITVFCSTKIYPVNLIEYKGCKLEYISFHANGIQSIPFDISSILKAGKRFDKVLILGASGGLIMPFLGKYRNKFILNFGGLDWQRSKWGFFAKQVLKFSELLAVKNSKFLIADNVGIQDYIKRIYKRESSLIAYGGDQVMKILPDEADYERYPFLNFPYAFSVARIQSDNNIDMILDSFIGNAPLPIVFVGNWSNSKYGIAAKEKYSKFDHIILLDPIYDQRELDLLRSNCTIYIHGHSAGGTNPSLVEAMNLGLPILAFTSGFNEFTTANNAIYFSSSKELIKALNNLNQTQLFSIGEKMKSIAIQNYRWELIAEKYSKIFEK